MTSWVQVGPRTYQFGVKLGRGACGLVFFAAEKETRMPCAIKLIEKQRVDLKYLKSEILNHRVLDHPHVIRFKAVYTDDQYVYIVMEYANGGNLRSYLERIGRMEENQARFIFQQLVIAVDYCHQKGVTNRDLKLENTLLNWEDQRSVPLVKICDFGFSKADYQSVARSRVGTLAYMAPEVILNKATSSYNAKLADVWSCGVMLYFMLCGIFPFAPQNDGNLARTNTNDQNVQQFLIRLIADGKWSFPEGRPLTAECKDLIRRMLCPAAQRLDLASVQRHPWFKQDLHPDAVTMNLSWIHRPLPADMQSEAEIAAELAKAMPASMAGPLEGDEFDDLIEAEIARGEGLQSSGNLMSV